jgi:hypothetical protein
MKNYSDRQKTIITLKISVVVVILTILIKVMFWYNHDKKK